jgi:hypothetical protein
VFDWFVRICYDYMLTSRCATKHVLTLSIRLCNIHPLDEKLLELRFNCF